MLKYLQAFVLEVLSLSIDEHRCVIHFSDEEELSIAARTST
jgi:hypothetical protein